MTDYDYEKFTLLSILEGKMINQLIGERIMSIPFPNEVNEAFDAKFVKDFYKLME